MECPDCSGSGKVLGLFVIRTDGGCDPCREFQCFFCDGSGAVPDETAAWMVTGKAMRDERLSRGHGLWKEADERKMKPSELSAMERGRVKPKPVRQA